MREKEKALALQSTLILGLLSAFLLMTTGIANATPIYIPPTQQGNDELAQVDAMLDNYLGSDVTTLYIGKLNVGTSGTTSPEGFAAPFENWSFEVTGLPGSAGTWTVTPGEVWSSPIFFSVKASNFWALYDSNLYDENGNVNLLPSQTVSWNTAEIPFNRHWKDLSHISFWTTDSGGGGVAPVPEPATMLLLGTGLAGLAGTRIRKRMQK